MIDALVITTSTKEPGASEFICPLVVGGINAWATIDHGEKPLLSFMGGRTVISTGGGSG